MVTITAVDKTATMTFDPQRGGMGTSLRFLVNNQSHELLYLHEPIPAMPYFDLIGGWPVLFPICARLARQQKPGIYLFEQQEYALPIHGFAPYLPWTVQEKTNDSLTLSLSSSAATRHQYPFEFKITLHYHLVAQQLICRQTYHNTGNKPMPYYAGFHPYFYTPDKAHTTLSYHAIEGYRYNETLTDVIARTAPPHLPATLNDPALNECLTRIAPDTLITLTTPHYILELTMRSDTNPDLFPYIQLYTMPDKPFFCIEHWMSFPNALNTVAGARWLAPQQKDTAQLTLTLHSPERKIT